ncbi:uncharacterized protein L203_102585 [Cryptococcus depauperatus CBS 7841]|uniref:Uncharacterized protein n=1 Tax=Cryptococcus depauperatus CBS 7841 TaxID=1295531 RepID=A0A1E3IG43_9TREE|nr:hypothetical protein L203_03949 [Cryptococcus depauperatus CBS 7841]
MTIAPLNSVYSSPSSTSNPTRKQPAIATREGTYIENFQAPGYPPSSSTYPTASSNWSHMTDSSKLEDGRGKEITNTFGQSYHTVFAGMRFIKQFFKKPQAVFDILRSIFDRILVSSPSTRQSMTALSTHPATTIAADNTAFLGLPRQNANLQLEPKAIQAPKNDYYGMYHPSVSAPMAAKVHTARRTITARQTHITGTSMPPDSISQYKCHNNRNPRQVEYSSSVQINTMEASIVQRSPQSRLADCQVTILQIMDNIDPLLACRICRMMYKRYISQIYSQVVISNANFDLLMEGYVNPRGPDGLLCMPVRQGKMKALSHVQSIRFEDIEGAKRFCEFFKSLRDLSLVSESQKAFTGVKKISFGGEMLENIRVARLAGLASKVRAYWSEFSMRLLQEIGCGRNDLSLCFDLEASEELWPPYGSNDSTPTSRIIDILSFGSIPSADHALTVSHCNLHISFNPNSAIPIILLPNGQNTKYTYHIAIAGRHAPRLFIRSLWMHFLIVRNKLPTLTDDNGMVRVPVFYKIPFRARLQESLEKYWVEEAQGIWSEDDWTRFKKSLNMRKKGEYSSCECCESIKKR